MSLKLLVIQVLIFALGLQSHAGTFECNAQWENVVEETILPEGKSRIAFVHREGPLGTDPLLGMPEYFDSPYELFIDENLLFGKSEKNLGQKAQQIVVGKIKNSESLSNGINVCHEIELNKNVELSQTFGPSFLDYSVCNFPVYFPLLEAKCRLEVKLKNKRARIESLKIKSGKFEMISTGWKRPVETK